MTNIFQCPHCSLYVEIAKMNCGIFRHGTFTKDFKQLPPHASMKICHEVVARKEIWGCGRPFRITPDGKIKPCGYI